MFCRETGPRRRKRKRKKQREWSTINRQFLFYIEHSFFFTFLFDLSLLILCATAVCLHSFVPRSKRGIGSCRIWIFLSDPIGFLWKMSDSDEIRHVSDRKRSDLHVGSLDLGIYVEKIKSVRCVCLCFIFYFGCSFRIKEWFTEN